MAAPPAIPLHCWWNGVRIEATLVADNDQVSIVVAPGQLLEVKLEEFRRATTHALVAAHSRPPDRQRPSAAPTLRANRRT